MILASHQPDFMPYPGFFYKILNSDVMDIAVFDQYSHQGYQRRVTMGENNEWVQMVVDKSTEDRKRIIDVEYDFDKSKTRILKAITKHYGNAKHYERVYNLVERVFDKQTVIEGKANLCMFNMDMLGAICLSIGIPIKSISVAIPLTKPKAEGILQLMSYYGADTYLSGNGAKVYITDEFEKAGKKLVWADYTSPTKNSIIEIMATEDDPLRIIKGE